MAPTKRPTSAASCAMAVMGKASSAGRAKTRLMPPLNAAEAARFNTAFLQDTVGNVCAAGRRLPVDPYVAYGPAGSGQFFRELFADGVGLIEACWPDFGDCLYGTIETLLESGHESACVLNSDSPTLPTASLVQAATLLAAPGDHAVLGPCKDGGYYLLGLKRAHRELFRSIDWSTERVCEQTRQRAAELGLTVRMLEPWYDVDDIGALRRLSGELSRPVPANESGAGMYCAPQTRSVLAHLTAHADLLTRLGPESSHDAGTCA